MYIQGEKVCVHDGVWKECPGGHEVGDFVERIEKAWNELNHDSTVFDGQNERETQNEGLGLIEM